MIPELKTLIAVARYGTFAAAADRVGLTQAAVSGHIRRLETALGFPLFERTGRSAVLNEAGQRTLARAGDIIARFDALGTDSPDPEGQGSLKVGALASMQATVVARALVPFHARFPLCQVHISPGMSLHLFDGVDTGDLDLAVLIRPPFAPPKTLLWQPLIRERYALLVPAGIEGEAWQDIVAQQPFIQYDRSSFGGRQVERLLDIVAIRPRSWLEIDDIQAIVTMVATGCGVAIAPLTQAILPLPSHVRAVSLGTSEIHRDIGIVIRKAAPSPAQAAFVECLLTAAAIDAEG